MSLWDKIIGRNKNILRMDISDIIESDVAHTASKRIAIESVIGFIARVIIQSEFRVREKDNYIKNKTYYKFNLKPNKNQSAARFWHNVVHRLIYDGECLIVKSHSDDLLIADDYMREEFAVREDRFSGIWVKGMELEGTFRRSEVLFFEYGNEELSRLVNSLFSDYGELISRMFETQKMKDQIRSTIDVDIQTLKTEEGQSNLQSFIDRSYKAIRGKAIALMPQQKGMEYKEHSKQGGSGQNIDEIDKTLDSFLDQVCHTVGLPPNLLKGDMADVEKLTRNGMKFCIDPIIRILSDEINMQFFSEREYLGGEMISIKRISYRDMFDIAVAVDKLRSSSVANGHELRDEIGLEHSGDPIHDEFIMTKNYDSIEGGDDE